MWTYTAAYLRQGGCLAVKLSGLDIMALFNQPHCGWNIVMAGTRQHAGGRVGAMEAARSLQHGPVRVKWNNHITEITDPFRGRTKGQILIGHVDAGFTAVSYTHLRAHET